MNIIIVTSVTQQYIVHRGHISMQYVAERVNFTVVKLALGEQTVATKLQTVDSQYEVALFWLCRF